MHVRPRAPTEREQPERQQRALDAGAVQTRFGDVGREGGGGEAAEDARLVDADGRHEHGADAHGGEDGVGLREREGVGAAEDERHGAERDVERGPREGRPEREEEDDGLGEEEVEGAEEGGPDHLGQRVSLLVVLALPADARSGAGCLLQLLLEGVEFLGPAPEEHGDSGLGEEQKEGGNEDAVHDRL